MKSLLLVSLLVFSSIAFAEEKEPEWVKFTRPGDAQKTLEPMVGSFTYTSKMWMDPKGKPMEAKGTSENKWILGGRFVQQTVKGTVMGQEFEGMGLLAYDSFKEEYQSIWIDNMTTGIMSTFGPGPANAKLMKASGTFSSAMDNDKNAPIRTETKVVSKNEHIYTMFGKGKDGKEFKAMELTYKRVK